MYILFAILASLILYSIPEDYLARGNFGLMALIPFAMACLSPVITFAVLRSLARPTR